MDKLSGLILDIYDDTKGDVLRTLYASGQDIPEQIKTAQLLQDEDRRALPDDVFALVLHDGDVTLRKYACVDAGNTVASVDYFLANAYKLPAEAQKVAAANLQVACGWYGLTPPEELEKIAMGALGAVGGLAAKGVGWAAKNPMRALGAAMTVGSVGGAVGQARQGLAGVARNEAVHGFGNLAAGGL